MYYLKVFTILSTNVQQVDDKVNLAKLGNGLDESPTVMVGDNDNDKNKNSVKIGAY